jgi:glycosyltransferase involved in cell wall biosynthesis
VKVSLVVPCYQEEEALRVWRSFLSTVPGDEVVFVDDGSTDGTAAALRELAAHDTRVRVETHATNLGCGAAMRTGIAGATGDVVVVYDADRTYPVEDAARLVAAVQGGADLATASPWGGGSADASVRWHRRVVSKMARVPYRWVLGRRAKGIATFTCAFRAYRKSLLERLRWRSDGFAGAAEMLGRAILLGATVVEVPSRLSSRTEGTSKMRFGRAAWGHLKALGSLLRARMTGE